ncbi:MAG: Uma2 family endonuclease [Verrucomicrobiota bacterium]|nr:Uma2 family endonuclease [Verrucomicrobiota bacterium]
MLPTTHQRMKAEEFWQLPEGPPYFQLIDGELFMSPSPRFRHQQVIGNIFWQVRAHLHEHRDLGDVVISPSDVELGSKDVYEPDIYFVSRERSGIFVEQGAKGAPDLVVEVLSPSTARLDRGPKLRGYAEAGVKEMWLVQLEPAQIEVWSLTDDRESPSRTLVFGDQLETPLIPGLTLDVREIFES